MRGENASDQGASAAPPADWFQSSVVLTNFLSPFSVRSRGGALRFALRLPLATFFRASGARLKHER
jgi:hypothetical protein